MASLLRNIEACLLVGMGAFMAVLSQSSMYWQFLNPRYSWLTLAAGAGLMIVGLGSLIDTGRKRHVSELLGILAFLVLAGTALETTPFLIDEPPPSGGGLTGEYQGEPDPTVVIGGVEYVRINVAELYLAEQEGTIAPGQTYALQGTVLRTEELDRAGYIGVVRLFIQCCFADSIGMASLVRVDDPEKYEDGAWVHVAGVIEEGAPLPGNTITVKGALTVLRSDRFSLRAVQVTQAQMEGVPFIFDMRSEPPYAY